MGSYSDCPTTRAAEMASANAQSATLAAKPARTGYRHHSHWDRPMIRCASPNQADDPPYNSPSKEKVHEKNQSGVVLFSANDCRQEVHKGQKKQEKHGRPLSTSLGGYRAF